MNTSDAMNPRMNDKSLLNSGRGSLFCDDHMADLVLTMCFPADCSDSCAFKSKPTPVATVIKNPGE